MECLDSLDKHCSGLTFFIIISANSQNARYGNFKFGYIVIKKGSKIYKETNKFIMHLFDVLFSENAQGERVRSDSFYKRINMGLRAPAVQLRNQSRKAHEWTTLYSFFIKKIYFFLMKNSFNLTLSIFYKLMNFSALQVQIKNKYV